MSATPLLELESISFGYGDGPPALDHVSVSIFPGERIAVLGNNGAGKSTLFLCCNGVLAPQSGLLRLKGEALGRKRGELLRLREAVGLVFQDPDDQILASTVEGEISFGPLNLGLDVEEVRGRVEDAISAMALEEHRARPPHYLSGGEKKRVTIADILAMNPELMLFDEPTSSLDPAGTRRLGEILEELRHRGMALMVATHDMNFAYAWAERALVFHKGKLLADRPMEEVFADEVLLKQAGLQRPLLYTAAEALCRAKGISLPQKLPKTPEELAIFAKELMT